MDEFISYLQRIGDLSIQCKGGTLYVLSRFVMNWPRLQIGGNLLPDMIEFYCWLHSNLAHTISINMASKYKISNVIRKARNRSSKEFSKHLSDLYHKVKENYNRYIELIGGFLSPGSGDNRLKKINLPAMNDDTVLIHLLSGMSRELFYLFFFLGGGGGGGEGGIQCDVGPRVAPSASALLNLVF